MLKQKCKCLFLALFLIIVCVRSAECLVAQEPTQLLIQAEAVLEMLNTLEMKLNQLKMLAQLPQSVINEMYGMKQLLSENFAQVRSILQSVGSITHFTDNIENMLKTRHPEWQAGLSIAQLKERSETRAKQLKQTFEAYLKAINITAKDFKNDEKTALQALGALLDHMNSMIARNEQTLQGFMTTYLEVERDELDEEEQNEQSLYEAYESLKNLSDPGETFMPGFKQW